MVAEPLHRRVRHPFGIRVGLSLAAHCRDGGAARPRDGRPAQRSTLSARRPVPHVGRVCASLPRRLRDLEAGDRRMSEAVHPVPHDGTDSEARPVFAQERRILGLAASTWTGIIAPVVIGIVMLAAWEAVVRIKGIPHYILPGPILIGQTLWSDWGTLSESLWITLRITFAALVAAVPGGAPL